MTITSEEWVSAKFNEINGMYAVLDKRISRMESIMRALAESLEMQEKTISRRLENGI